MHLLPGWLWLIFMVVLLVVGIVTQDAMAFAVVAASVALTVIIALIRRAFTGGD